MIFEEIGVAFESSEFDCCNVFMVIKFKKSDLDSTSSRVFKASAFLVESLGDLEGEFPQSIRVFLELDVVIFQMIFK